MLKPLQRTDRKNRIAFWTLVITGLFLLLSGWQPIAYGINDAHPYAVLGIPMLFLGLAMILLCAAGRGTLKGPAILIVGLFGQCLLGIVAFIIPFLQPVQYFPDFPFNFHTYSVVLGGLGIALSLESITLLARY